MSVCIPDRDRKRNFLAMRLYQRQEHPQKIDPARLQRKLGRLQQKYREQLANRKPKWSEWGVPPKIGCYREPEGLRVIYQLFTNVADYCPGYIWVAFVAVIDKSLSFKTTCFSH